MWFAIKYYQEGSHKIGTFCGLYYYYQGMACWQDASASHECPFPQSVSTTDNYASAKCAAAPLSASTTDNEACAANFEECCSTSICQCYHDTALWPSIDLSLLLIGDKQFCSLAGVLCQCSTRFSSTSWPLALQFKTLVNYYNTGIAWFMFWSSSSNLAPHSGVEKVFGCEVHCRSGTGFPPITFLFRLTIGQARAGEF
eukprot:3155186-Rhodomonas_salina.1